jgi:hypothetical protein
MKSARKQIVKYHDVSYRLHIHKYYEILIN